MQILYYFLFALSQIISYSFAQNYWQTFNGPLGGTINSVVITSNKNLIAATGIGIYFSTNNGNTWNETSIQSNANCLLLTKSNDIFVGTDAGIFISTDDGLTWNFNGLENIPVGSLAQGQNNYIWAGIGSLYSGGGGVYYSTDEGKNWLISNNSYNRFLGLCVDSKGYIYGASDYSVFRSIDNGTSWTSILTLSSSTTYNRSVISTDSLIISGSVSDGIYISSDEGNNWFKSNTGLKNQEVLSLNYISKDTIICGTDSGIYISSNSGSSWNILGLPGQQVFSISHDIAGNIYAGTLGSGLFFFSKQSSTWNKIGVSRVPISFFNFGLNNCILVLSYDSDNYKSIIYRSTDNGLNWSEVFSGGSGRGSLYNIPGTGIFLIGVNGQGIWRSIDNGLDWTNVLKTSNDLPFVGGSAKNIFMGYQTSWFASSDSGRSWIRKNQSIQISTILAVQNNILLSGYYYGNGIGISRSSNNSGNTWNPSNNGLGTTQITCLIINRLNNNIFAGSIGTGGGVYKSIDNGYNWQQVNNGLINTDVISMISDAYGNIFAGTLDGGVYKSTNDGADWTQVNSGLPYIDLNSLSIDSSGYIYAATDVGGFKSTNPILNSIKFNPVSEPLSFYLSQNYPNPFNPITTINYSVSKPSFISIKVYDVLGKIIKTLVNEEKPVGNYSVEFNANKHASGIYFYTMQAGNFIETKKLILLK